MTAVEWLIEKIGMATNDPYYTQVVEQAKEMEKQQMKDVLFEKVLRPFQFNFEQYYNETYGSKESDKEKQKKLITEIMNEDDDDGLYESKESNEHIVDTNEMVKPATISKKEMVEISDEEIIKAAFEYCLEIYQKVSDYENYDTYNDFIIGAKWYREQLRQRK